VLAILLYLYLQFILVQNIFDYYHLWLLLSMHMHMHMCFYLYDYIPLQEYKIALHF